jgi:two-component system phosphate regulon sensor histidine kinase PhoR
VTVRRRLLATYVVVSVALVGVTGPFLYDSPTEFLVAIGVVLAAAIVAAELSARRLGRAIGELRASSSRVAKADLEIRRRIAAGDELEEVGDVLDAATRRLAERVAAATAERDRLEGVLDAMVEGVVVTDGQCRVALANAALLRLFGIEGTIDGRSVLQALRHSEAADALADAVRRQAPVARDVQVRWPAERVLALHAVALPGGGAVGVFHDVTERRRLDDVRRDFVANVSHELRTPLATLTGYAEELADPALSPDDARRASEVIRRHVSRMTALVEDLLELARIEADRFAPTREPLDARTLLTDVAREWGSRAETRAASLVVENGEGIVLVADRRLLRQALAHLLDNALKYGPRGGEVRLSARPVPGGAELAVSDQGPGIPPEDLPRVFERFYRVEKGRSREAGGTGLGLAIVKHVAEAHGGRAWVDSRPGKGAVFRIFVPE